MGIALKQSEINANPKLAKNAIIRREKSPLRSERIGGQKDEEYRKPEVKLCCLYVIRGEQLVKRPGGGWKNTSYSTKSAI